MDKIEYNKTFKELAITESRVNDNNFEDLCPIIVFEDKGVEFLEHIYCDEDCSECWCKKQMSDTELESLLNDYGIM